jgi:hypothetical protein
MNCKYILPIFLFIIVQYDTPSVFIYLQRLVSSKSDFVKQKSCPCLNGLVQARTKGIVVKQYIMG